MGVRALWFLVLLAVAGCGADTTDTSTALGTQDPEPPGSRPSGEVTASGSSADARTSAYDLPPANSSFDYQLGGAYPPAKGVALVSRDRLAAPAPGIYNICYVNGFQTQPDERDFWTDDHPELLLQHPSTGDYVIDPAWDEIILDVRTRQSRAALVEIVGGWIEGCADAGFDAIEIDNLDTYARSEGLIDQESAVTFMASLSGIAHERGMAISQKNSAEVLDRIGELGTDFAVVEECNQFRECGDYTAIYGDQIYVIEYREEDFDFGCENFADVSIAFRDLDLVTPTDDGYIYESC